jgi:hypothetical protein
MPSIAEANAAMGEAFKRPARMYIVDLRSAALPPGQRPSIWRMDAQFNPTELEETLGVNWVRLNSLGLSHEILQYGHTESLKFSFELYWDALDDQIAFDKFLQARQFLQSTCYPKRGAQSIREGQAPRVLFVWPNFISLTCVIDRLSFKYKRFNTDGQPTLYTCKVDVMEIRDARLFSEDVLDGGSKRNSALPEGV